MELQNSTQFNNKGMFGGFIQYFQKAMYYSKTGNKLANRITGHECDHKTK